MYKMRILIAAPTLFFLSIEDLRTRKVNIILPIVAGLLSLFLFDSLIMCIISLIPGLILIILSKVIKGIGEGDGYVILSLGMITGIDDTLTTMLIAFILASFYSGYLTLIKKCCKDMEFAFVPFIGLGYLICVLAKAILKTA